MRLLFGFFSLTGQPAERQTEQSYEARFLRLPCSSSQPSCSLQRPDVSVPESSSLGIINRSVIVRAKPMQAREKSMYKSAEPLSFADKSRNEEGRLPADSCLPTLFSFSRVSGTDLSNCVIIEDCPYEYQLRAPRSLSYGDQALRGHSSNV